MTEKKDKGALIIGGATLIGVGVGFIFLQYSALFFVASIIIGIGIGFLINAILPKK